MASLRITILTPYYPPEMGAPPARLYEIAVRLVRMGHEVTVVTAHPNRPTGKIYPGYGASFRVVTTEDGVRVIRTWIRPSANSSSFLFRLMNDLSFTFSSGWFTADLLGKQDVLLVQNPPLFSGINAGHLARKTGAKVVMWCGDVWPDVLLQSGQMRNGLMARFMRRLQQFCFHRSDLLAVTNPRVATDTAEAYETPPVVVWSNGVDTDFFRPENRDEALRARLGVEDGQILIGYVGLHGRFQGLDTIVQAARLLREDGRFRFVFVGEGVEKQSLIRFCEENHLSHVAFRDPIPKKEVPALVASCDVGVVSLLTRMPGTMPSKFYETVASGTIPLVADGCEAAPLVRSHSAGCVYEPGDAESAAEALRRVAAFSPEERMSMSARCRELSARFDRDTLAAYLETCLQALASGREPPTCAW